MKDTEFFIQLPNFVYKKTDNNMLVPKLMTKILSQTNRGIPVVKDSIQLDVTKTLIEINQSDDDNLLPIELQSDEMNDIGGSS